MIRCRVGVVGAGVIGRRHVRTLARFTDVVVAAIADPQQDRARELAATVDATAYDDVRRMLDSESLDAVYVCVPPFAHGAPDLAVVERGLAMFVEKPIAADFETAEQIAARIAELGLITGVGHHWRWLDTVEQARELLVDRPVRLANGYWLDATPPIRWWQSQRLSGGQFIEQTTHVVDLARLLVGEVEEVFAYASRTDRPDYPDSDLWDVTAVSARFASGSIGSFTSTCLLRWPHRVGLHLFSEGMAIELTEKQLLVDVGDGPRITRASGDPFEREDRAFIDAVRGKPDRTRTTYAEALQTHKVTTTVLRSAAEGVPLRVDGARRATTGSGGSHV